MLLRVILWLIYNLDSSQQILIDSTINSIYATIFYEFSGIVCHENQFINDFKDELKKYVGENLKVTAEKENNDTIKCHSMLHFLSGFAGFCASG